MQLMLKVQQQLTELRNEVRASIGKNPHRPHEAASDEVVIGGWLQKSKDGAVKLVEKNIEGKASSCPYFATYTQNNPKIYALPEKSVLSAAVKEYVVEE